MRVKSIGPSFLFLLFVAASGDRSASTRPMVRAEDGTLRLVFDLVFR